jgi:hypothetical protein
LLDFSVGEIQRDHAGSELDFPDDFRERSIAMEQGYCSLLESGLGKLEAFQSA